MASGINSSFRQVGIAAGVAALGSIFAGQIRNGVATALSGTALAHSAHQIAIAVSSGHVAQVISHAPVSMRGQIAAASTGSFVHALNSLLLIAAVVALAGAGLALLLIRRKDLLDASAPAGAEHSWSPDRPQVEVAA